MDEKKRLLMASSSSSSGAMEKQAIAAVEQQHQQLEVLKCPRCDSSNTKFCYYNNYSLSQPRHFCKACKRYWTRGGTLRNVPVGGGCRKNKRLKIIRPPVPPVTTTSTNNRIVNPIFSAYNYPSARDQLGGLGGGGGEVNYYYSSSSSSSCPSTTSLLASTIQHQTFFSGGNLQLKDDYSSLKPLLYPLVQNGSSGLAAMNKVQAQMNYNYMINPVGGNGWNNNYLGYQQNYEMEEQLQVIGLSTDPNYNWSMSNPSNNWHDPPASINEPSVLSLI